MHTEKNEHAQSSGKPLLTAFNLKNTSEAIKEVAIKKDNTLGFKHGDLWCAYLEKYSKTKPETKKEWSAEIKCAL
jgi:hypothetical protein